MTAPRATFVQRALGGHAAIGLIAGALIYIVALTGTLIVIHGRWEAWETPGVVATPTFSPAAAQAALAAAIARDARKPRSAHAFIEMPTADAPRAVVTTDHGASYVDAAGRLVAPADHPWTDFVTALHEYLTLPGIWGLALVGIMGVMLVALTLTGVLAHPRILRDAFRLRIRHDAQIARADWHNRLGVWTLPFVLAVSVTGSFIGLGGVGVGLLARAYTGGDTLAVYAAIFGKEAPPNPAAAPLADVGAALATLAARAPGERPTFVTIHDPGTRGQHIQILADQPRRLVYGEAYSFDARGRWQGKLGLSDGPIGRQAAASAYNLHFGNYAGLPVEIAYMAMGLGLCVVTATGTTLWLCKRRRRGLGGERLIAAWAATIWGVPLVLVALVWATAALPAAPAVPLFWGALVVVLAIAIARPATADPSRLRTATMAAILATAIGHAALAAPTAIDGVAAVCALAVLAAYRQRSARA